MPKIEQTNNNNKKTGAKVPIKDVAKIIRMFKYR